MKKYNNFSEYMEDNYYEEIFNKIKEYIALRKDSFESDEIYKVSWVNLENIGVCGVTFDEGEDKYLVIRTTIDAEIEVKGKTSYGYDSIGVQGCYNVFFSAILDDGLHEVKITKVDEYNERQFDRNKSLSQNLIPYMYEEDVERHAEEFLRKYCPKALLQPMTVPVEEIVQTMGMTMYFAPLEEGIFGKTYFDSEKVKVYSDIRGTEVIEIIIAPGTMLINPNVYFMYNIGTANNTIIHECVHWDRHRRAFELQKLLQGNIGHISCEIVEGEYNGIGHEESALKWMEWQANQLAPRILMPEKTTRRVFNKILADVHATKPMQRYAETLEETVGLVANYFLVSRLAAKLRLFELGFEEVEGTCVYCDGKGLPPYAFKKGLLDKNHSFVIDEENLIRSIVMTPKLMELYAKGVLVYANCMLCFNDPRYVMPNENNQYILTDYALEHADECCFLFKRNYNAGDKYSDTFYRRCFLCREIDAQEFVPVEYDPNHEINQTKEKMQSEIDAIMGMVNEELKDVHENMKGGFAGALDYFMKSKGISEYELQDRTGISTVSISGYRNTYDPTMEKGTVLALCKGLYLRPHEAIYLLDAADIKLTNMTPSNIFVRILIENHMDDTWEQWVEKLIMSGVSKDWIPARNNVVKEVKERI